MKRVIAFILFITALAILLTLGTWQIQRLAWKKEIIHQLNGVYATDAKDITYDFDDLKISDADLPVLYGSVDGEFDYHDEILFGPRTYEGDIGYYVITPLSLTGGGIILINRGFIAQDQKDKIAQTHVSGTLKISGLMRAPDWNSFTPNNSPENNIWTKLDIEQIASTKNLSPIAPFILYAESFSKPMPLLKAQEERWMPRNKHQQYAIFWYGMALVLCGVFGSFIYSRRKIN